MYHTKATTDQHPFTAFEEEEGAEGRETECLGLDTISAVSG